MPISVFTTTTVSCDGSETTPCPESSAASYEQIQSVALRMARRDGWKIEGTVMCVTCTEAAASPAPVTSPLSIVATRREPLVNQTVQELGIHLPVLVTLCEPPVQLFGRGVRRRSLQHRAA